MSHNRLISFPLSTVPRVTSIPVFSERETFRPGPEDTTLDELHPQYTFLHNQEHLKIHRN